MMIDPAFTASRRRLLIGTARRLRLWLELGDSGEDSRIDFAVRQEMRTWSFRWPQVFVTRWTWHILEVLGWEDGRSGCFRCGWMGGEGLRLADFRERLDESLIEKWVLSV